MAQRRRSLACLLTFAVAAAPGCAASTYQIKHSELERLASLPPESRGASVRVEQELSGSEVETQPEVTSDTQIVFFPRIVVTRDYAPPRDAHQVGTRPNLGSHSNPGRGGSGHSGGGGSVGGGGSGGGGKIADDAKAAAIVAIAVAVTAVVVVAVIEGSRFHGDVQLHPMHPVHLFGRDGNYVAMPLAALDPNVVAWADHAVVRRDEGPWQELARAPLVREGWSYGVMMGAATLKSADGSVATGASTSIELGRYFNQQIGLFAFAQFGWRTNAVGETIFDQRYGAQAQFMPLTVSVLSLGLYGNVSFGVRGEDGLPNTGRTSSFVGQGGVQAQLDINTNIAITARAGVVKAYNETTREALIGLSVY